MSTWKGVKKPKADELEELLLAQDPREIPVDRGWKQLLDDGAPNEEGDDSLRPSWDLMDTVPGEALASKGAMALKALPFVMAPVKGNYKAKAKWLKEQGESFWDALRLWQYDSHHASRDKLAQMDLPKEAQQETIRRISRYTQHRTNPETGKREFLLYRGRRSNRPISSYESSSWSTKPGVADSFTPGNADGPKVNEAWIPEDKIAMYLPYIGQPRGEAGFRGESEVIVRKLQDRAVRDKLNSSFDLKPLVPSVHERLNEAAKAVQKDSSLRDYQPNMTSFLKRQLRPRHVEHEIAQNFRSRLRSPWGALTSDTAPESYEDLLRLMADDLGPEGDDIVSQIRADIQKRQDDQAKSTWLGAKKGWPKPKGFKITQVEVTPNGIKVHADHEDLGEMLFDSNSLAAYEETLANTLNPSWLSEAVEELKKAMVKEGLLSPDGGSDAVKQSASKLADAEKTNLKDWAIDVKKPKDVEPLPDFNLDDWGHPPQKKSSKPAPPPAPKDAPSGLDPVETSLLNSPNVEVDGQVFALDDIGPVRDGLHAAKAVGDGGAVSYYQKIYDALDAEWKSMFEESYEEALKHSKLKYPGTKIRHIKSGVPTDAYHKLEAYAKKHGLDVQELEKKYIYEGWEIPE